MNRGLINILLVLSVIGLGIGAWLKFRQDKPLRKLPYINAIAEGQKQKEDTEGKHIIMDFSLRGQDGKTVTRANVSGSIFVADFFFTNCKSICPIMTNQLERVYVKYKGDPEVKFISHTVDPARDSVEAMAAYASMHGADAKQWFFVTGDKPQLYELARKSYLISATSGRGDTNDFVHSQLFSLVDKEGYIRGIYDGTDSVDVDRLMIDMEVLLKGYHSK